MNHTNVSNSELASIYLGGAYFEITSVCNADCPYCYNDSSMRGEHLDKEIILRNLGLLKELQAPVSVTISGGEPCMHPDFLEIMEMTEGLDPLLITNGYFLSDKSYRNIWKKCRVQLTLEHPSPLLHDKIRGIGNFKAIETASQLLKENDVRQLRARVNVSKYNMMYLEDFAQLALQLGFTELHYAFLIPSKRTEKNIYDISFNQNAEVALEVIEKIEQIKRQEWKDSDGHILHIVNKCQPRISCALVKPSVQWIPRISSDGNVYVCEGFQSKEAVVGNLYCNTLAEITHSEQLRQVINRVQYRNGAIENCKACSWYKMCIKGCPGENMLSTGEVMKKGADCPFYKKYYLKHINKLIASNQRDNQDFL